MKMNEYQELSARTANGHDNERANFALGLTGEAGEVADNIKKEQFHGHEPNPDEIEKELGDVLWYLSQIARVYDLKLEDIAERNINKLKKRFPEGFDKEASKNREEYQSED